MHMIKSFLKIRQGFPIIIACLVVCKLYGQDTLRISLVDLWQRAISENGLLRAYQVSLSVDSAQLRSVWGGYLPRVDAHAGYYLLDVVPKTKESFIGDKPHDILATVSVQQSVYDGGYRRNTIKLKQALMQKDAAVIEDKKLNLKFEIAKEYYHLQYLQKQIEVLKENLKSIDEHLRNTRLLVECGKVSSLETKRLDVARAEMELRYISISNKYAASSRIICVLIGELPLKVVRPVDSLSLDTFQIETSEIISSALQNSIVLQRYSAEISMADASVAVARAGRLPKISAGAWYGWEFGVTGFGLFDNDRYWLGLSSTVPIYDGRSFANKILSEKLLKRELGLKRDYFRTQLEQVLRNLVAELKEHYSYIEILHDAIVQARESLKLGMLEYQAGKRMNTDIIDMQTKVMELELRINKVYADYNTTKAKLLLVTGIL